MGMENVSSWSLTAEEKKQLISALTPELSVLRTKAEISQEELSEMIGVSRQTYGSIERGDKVMSWSTFLSLVLFYDCNEKTHQMLRQIKAIPQVMLKKFNADAGPKDISLGLFLGEGADFVLNALDDQAIRSIRTMIMVEYSRCTSTPGDVVVKSFDGINFAPPRSDDDIAAEQALKAIRERNKEHDQQGNQTDSSAIR